MSESVFDRKGLEALTPLATDLHPDDLFLAGKVVGEAVIPVSVTTAQIIAAFDGSALLPTTPIQLRVTATHIQWRALKDTPTEWQDLIALSTLKGPQGPQGVAGSDGAPGFQGPPGPPGSDASVTAGDGVTVTSGVVAVNNTVLRTSGNQTVAGVKTYSSIPVLPATNPTTDNQAVRKAYVDGLVGGIDPGVTSVSAGTGVTVGGTSSVPVVNVSYGTAAGTAAQGNDTRIVNAVQTTRSITAGDGLTGGGDLTANRTLAVDSSVVRTSGAYTLAGAITHSVIPTLPDSDPTTANQAVRKAYVDSTVGAVDTGVMSVAAGTGTTVGGTATNRTVNVIYGTAANTAAVGNDTRIVNAVQTSRSVSTGTGLTGGGNLTADRTLAVDSTVVRTTGAFTLAGAITHSVIPELPASDPTTANQAVRKAYVDNLIAGFSSGVQSVTAGTGVTIGGTTADPTVGVVYGTTANTAAQGNDSRIVGAVQTSRTITAGDGLTGGGSLAANRTLAVDSSVIRADGSVPITGVQSFTQRPVLPGISRDDPVGFYTTTNEAQGLLTKSIVISDSYSPSEPIRRLDIRQSSTNDTDGIVLRSSLNDTNVAGHMWAGTGGFVIDARRGDLTGAANLHLRTGGIDRFVISAEGSLRTSGSQDIITSNGYYVLPTSAYLLDRQGNERLYFGADNTNNGILLKMSSATQVFQIRNSGNSPIFTVNAAGALSVGEIPWGRITGAPATATSHPSWDNVTSKPSTFAPAAHNQAFSTITGRATLAQLPTSSTANRFLKVGTANSNVAYSAIAASDLPAHSAALITSGSMDAARIGSGVLADARIPKMDASKIATGTFTTDRIPNLNASKITAGTLDAARIPVPTWGAVGTYIIAGSTAHTGANTVYLPNTTVAGSTLRANSDSSNVAVARALAGTLASNMRVMTANAGSLSLSGTWRLLTRVQSESSIVSYPLGLWVRIS